MDLAEDADAQAIGAQGTIKDVDRHLEAFVRGLLRRIPVGDDDAAEGIGRSQRHEGDGVQRGAPQIAVDANTTAATTFFRLFLVGPEDIEATAAEDAIALTAWHRVIGHRKRLV